MVLVVLQEFVVQNYREKPGFPQQRAPINRTRYCIQIPGHALPALRWQLNKEKEYPQLLTEECSLFTSINMSPSVKIESSSFSSLNIISPGVIVQLFHLPQETFSEAEMLNSQSPQAVFGICSYKPALQFCNITHLVIKALVNKNSVRIRRSQKGLFIYLL